MHAYDELKNDLHRRWEKRFTRIKEANRNFAARVKVEPLVFELDVEDDSLSVGIGVRPELAYTQSVDNLYIDMDELDDRIVGITIEDFSEWLNSHDNPALKDLAAALRHLGRIDKPADRRAGRVEEEIAELWPPKPSRVETHPPVPARRAPDHPRRTPR